MEKLNQNREPSPEDKDFWAEFAGGVQCRGSRRAFTTAGEESGLMPGYGMKRGSRTVLFLVAHALRRSQFSPSESLLRLAFFVALGRCSHFEHVANINHLSQIAKQSAK